jgi:predicted trehalose synthase
MNPYTIQQLKKNLIYIFWARTPGITEAHQFVRELQSLLDAEEENQLFFISDLRRGRIIDIRVIQMLSRLSQHEKWAGSVAFTTDPVSRSFVNIFQNMIVEHKERNMMFDEFEKAYAFLEQLEPGIMGDIDWQAVLAGTYTPPSEN